jgi:transcription factor 1
MLPGITDPTLPEEQRLSTARTPRELDLREWALVVNAFKNWPFRPMVRSSSLSSPFWC